MSCCSVRALGAVGFVAVLTGCATSAGNASSPAPGDGVAAQAAQAGTQRTSRYVLTSVDLMGAGTTNVYDALQKLRPEFLRQRGVQTIAKANVPTSSRSPGGAPQGGERNTSTGEALPLSAAPIVAYENDVKLESVDQLRRIDSKVVIEIRYIPGPEASIRYGNGHSAGVIIVKTT